MKSSVNRSSSIFVAILALSLLVVGQGSYKQPPKEVMDVLNAPVIPQTIVSPARDKILILTPLRYPPIAELAQPMLRIAGSEDKPNQQRTSSTSLFR